MQVKQVFESYRRGENDDQGLYRHCPICGTALTLKETGGMPRQACANCGFVQYRNPLPGVVVVIEEQGCVLLGRRRGGFGAGKWGLPQGYIEFDEDFLAAAIREAKEETGLDVEIRSILNVASNLLSPRLHTLAIVLLAKVIAGELRPGDDVDALEWVPFSGPLPEMAFQSDAYAIERYTQIKSEGGLPVDPDYASQVWHGPAH